MTEIYLMRPCIDSFIQQFSARQSKHQFGYLESWMICFCSPRVYIVIQNDKKRSTNELWIYKKWLEMNRVISQASWNNSVWEFTSNWWSEKPSLRWNHLSQGFSDWEELVMWSHVGRVYEAEARAGGREPGEQVWHTGRTEESPGIAGMGEQCMWTRGWSLRLPGANISDLVGRVRSLGLSCMIGGCKTELWRE